MGVSRRDSAVSTITANFEARNDDVKAAIALDLSFEAVEKVALKLGNFAASETRHMNVISVSLSLVIVPLTVDVHKIEFVYQPLAL